MARAAPRARSPTPASCYLRFSMSSARQELLRLLATKSFRLGEFKLSSGGTSDYYIDCRTTTLDAKGSRLTGEVFSGEIRQQGLKPQRIVAREEAKGRPSVEKAAAPAPFISIFTARDVRTEHVMQMDDTSPVIFAVA